MFLDFRNLLPEMLVTLGTAILSIFWNDIEDPPSEYPASVHGDEKHSETYVKTTDTRLLTSAQKNDLTDGGNSTAHYHTADRAATTLGGLSLNSTDRNNEASKVMRTDASGYANFGWINTTSGDTASSLSRVFVNTGDGYIRMCTLVHLMGQLRPHLIVYGSFSGNNVSNRVISTGLSKQTRIVWVMSADGYQFWGRAGCTYLIHSLAVGSFQINYNAALACNVSGKNYYWLALCF